MEITLFLDTCALLDIVRAPARAEFHPSYLAQANGLLALAQSSGSGLRICVCDVVVMEYERNLEKVIAETESILSGLVERYQHSLSIFGNYPSATLIPCGDAAWVRASVQLGVQQSKEIIQSAVLEPMQDSDQAKAGNRVFGRIPPSKQAKDNFADCAITEVALRMAHASTAEKFVFISSNTSEYWDKEQGTPIETLRIEFEAAGIVYSRNWGEAAYNVKRYLKES